MSDEPRGPVDALVVPRFAGPATFARLPRLDEVERCDVAIVGVPFDSNPFIINEAISQIEAGAGRLLDDCKHIIALGGDHTIALPLLRASSKKFGKLAVVHFDTHLDTWQGHFGVSYNHGTPFRRASEEGLLRLDRCVHVGVHGSIYSDQDLIQDAELGFQIVSTMDLQDRGVDEAVGRIKRRVGDAPMYVSVDIDVLDPAHAPGTGTPEAGGMSTRELLAVLRRLVDLNLVGADIVEVAPAYDHAEITAIAAAHVGYELLAMFARRSGGKTGEVPPPTVEVLQAGSME